nr:hypothetical protein [Tanacetum cinerariifolium]
MDPFNPPPPASESEPEDAIEVDNPIKHEDETVPSSVHEVGESFTAPFLHEDCDGLLPGLMRKEINSLFGWMASLLRGLCGRETTHALVEKEGKAKDEFYGKLILDLGNEVHSSVEQGMVAMEKQDEKLGNAEGKVECKKLKKKLEEARGIMFEERPNEAIDVPIKDEEQNVDAAIAAEQARHANVGNDARGFGPVKGQDAVPAALGCTFAGFMKCNPTAFRGTEGAVKLLRWFEKTGSVFKISECVEGKKVRLTAATLQGPALTWWNSKAATMCLVTVNQMPWTEMKQLMTAEFNELALICLRMVKPERVKDDAYIQGLTDNIKGEITSSKPTNLSEAVRMAHKLMDQKLCFTHHVGPCKIKCHKCRKVRHNIRYCKEKNVATSVNALPIPTCYDCGEQCHSRNQCPKKVKQEGVREVYGRAYAIKDAEPKGLNVVTGTFLLNNCYAFVLFNSGFDRSFVDTRFSSMLDIDPVKIGASYEVELADGRVVSTNTVLKGCTLNLVNHVFEIDLMPIELGTFYVIIGMDWLVKHDTVISCINARKYVERGCHLFLANVTENKTKEKRLEDVPVICDFLEVFLEELPGISPSRQVEFRINLVPRAALVVLHRIDWHRLR